MEDSVTYGYAICDIGISQAIGFEDHLRNDQDSVGGGRGALSSTPTPTNICDCTQDSGLRATKYAEKNKSKVGGRCHAGERDADQGNQRSSSRVESVSYTGPRP